MNQAAKTEDLPTVLLDVFVSSRRNVRQNSLSLTTALRCSGDSSTGLIMATSRRPNASSSVNHKTCSCVRSFTVSPPSALQHDETFHRSRGLFHTFPSENPFFFQRNGIRYVFGRHPGQKSSTLNVSNLLHPRPIDRLDIVGHCDGVDDPAVIFGRGEDAPGAEFIAP